MLKRTPLHDEHLKLGARMAPFAGYEMPVHYPPGIRAEHGFVRESTGLFDVSHMGEIEVGGPGALDLLQYVTVNDVAALDVGRAQYSALCAEDGGVLDDLLVYRRDDRYMLVVNAANREADLEWVTRWAEGFDVGLTDRSDALALLALQGPHAERVLAPRVEGTLSDLGYYRFRRDRVADVPAIVSRTGYTGEDGFEIYVDRSDAEHVWRELLTDESVHPVGIGARDSLRLEMGYALYGEDLDVEHTPLESGLGWITKLEKDRFVGKEALCRQRREGVPERLVGLRLLERGFPRAGQDVVELREARGDVETVGRVTSGTVSPTLGHGIALAYVGSDRAEAGARVAVRIRDRHVPAEVVRPPFYREGSLRR